MNNDNVRELREIMEWIKSIDTGNENYNYKLNKINMIIEDLIMDMSYDSMGV